MIANALLMAIRQIARNVMRSTLTTLGILIGVAAVIAMVGLGRGAAQRVENDLSGLGRNLLFLVPGTPGHGPGGPALGAKPFTLGDLAAVRREIPGLAAAAPSATRGTVAINGDARWKTMITGTDNAYFTALNWKFLAGREFADGELRAGAAVCVLGNRVRHELFGAQDPIDARVRIGTISCRVVGTLSPKGQSTFGQDQDDFVLVPLRTYQRRISGTSDVNAIFLSAAAGASTERVKANVEALMLERRHIRAGDEPDFVVRDMKEIEQMVGGITGVLTALLGAIAAVSLLVGGIGIMNIMLVAVTERTREIGIRLAIGARAREVLVQFLVESIVLATFGGITGIALGLGATWVATSKLGLPFTPWQTIVPIAFAFSTFIGVAFGYFPARKAAHLNPIDALRYE